MTKTRFEAFSDAVIAIILTIMVLELRPPHEHTFEALYKLYPIFGCYVLSFVYLGIYWNNHHHMIHSVKHVSGGVLWANLHLLFWLSLVPFTTAWMGETHFAMVPVAIYGIVLLGNALAYAILTIFLVKANGKDSEVAKALGRDFKGKISIVIYTIGIIFAFIAPVVAGICYLAVACIWLVPDRRFEHLHNDQS